MAAERTGQQRGSPPAVFLMGPTAAGKTGFAVELVERLPMQIISVDSALVYRGLDVGTAKPDPEVLARAPHRLIDIRDPQQPYSVAEFREDALAAMEEITAAGEVPLLVGGTMLYFRALTEGLSDLPAASGSIRRKLKRQATEEGWPALHRRLAELDPRAASRIDPNDPQRIQRALEVIALSGRPMSALQRENRPEPLPYEVLKIVVCPAQRAALHRRIERRFEQMLERGFEQEVRRLHQTPGLHAGLPAMRAVGYRQAWAWLDGHLGPEEWPKRAVAATRQLAKRQLTWLRKERDALWYDFTADGARQAAFGAIGQFLKMAP